MNKSILLSICLALPVVSNAATLYFDSFDNIALSNGNLMTAGKIEFGYFDPSTSFALAPAALYDQFYSMLNYDVAASTFTSGNTYTYSTTGSRTKTDGSGSIPYDLSGDNSNVAGDIAGGVIYALVYNGASFELSTEIGVFSAEAFGFLWNDNQDVAQDAFFSFGLDSGTGMVAQIGTASVDPFTTPHSLAAIPEPSRALLGLIGLTGVMFRRRRAAKA
jgi:hypothetical protein